VYKAQGCEWRKVFLILHKDHSVMAYRELLYTAVTRAAKEMVVIAKDFMIEKAIKTQRIKGNSLADKIEFFNAKVSMDVPVKCYK
jgi:exodeoxyribonuclease V alpha subunit